MKKITIEERTLHFKQPAGTSRGVYTTRKIWLLKLTDSERPGAEGWGECAPLPDLSAEYRDDFEKSLHALCDFYCQTGSLNHAMLRPYPSVLFALETAEAQLNAGGSKALSDTAFARGERGIPINGLVWMGNFDEMNRRMEEKLSQGFGCVKLKIGAIAFDEELELIRRIRQRFSHEQIELRVDANGAFSPDDAMDKLEQLSRYHLHSIEQPLRQHQWEAMSRLCRNTPLPIALDEELIGINIPQMKEDLLDTIRPQYLVIKPSLHGGMVGTEEWVRMARERGIGSWITSALESNVGLNAVAHLAAKIYGDDITMAQGLGTGQLFTDNIDMPLSLHDCRIWFEPEKETN